MPETVHGLPRFFGATPTRCPSAGRFVALAFALVVPAPARADGTPTLPRAEFRYLTDDPTQPAETPARAPRFGEAGSRWWTVSTGVADNFLDAVDTNIALTYSYFLTDDPGAGSVEFALEGAAWYANQPGDNAFALSAVAVFRWHFWRHERWTTYIDGGVGIGVGTDEIPDGGTSWDLMPRAGAGFTRLLDEDTGLRLQMGVRWHHFSNARIFGDAKNPSRDGAMIYAGLMFPF